MTYEDGIDKKTFTNLKELKKRIEDIGYAVESIHINRRAESNESDEMGTADERHPPPDRGNSPNGAVFRLKGEILCF